MNEKIDRQVDRQAAGRQKEERHQDRQTSLSTRNRAPRLLRGTGF